MITEIIHTEANDVWVAKSGEEETLIPALREVIVRVDSEDKRVVVRGMTMPEG